MLLSLSDRSIVLTSFYIVNIHKSRLFDNCGVFFQSDERNINEGNPFGETALQCRFIF